MFYIVVLIVSALFGPLELAALLAVTGAGAQALRDAERHAASVWAGVGIMRPEPA